VIPVRRRHAASRANDWAPRTLGIVIEADEAPIVSTRFRTLAPGELELHRTVRLQALRDAPQAFEDRHEVLADRPAQWWADLTAALTDPGFGTMVLAFDETDAAIGSVYGFGDRSREGTARVGGMWVDSVARGRGVGAGLLGRVIDWASGAGFVRIALWAPDDTPAAQALYTRAGFVETGLRRPLPSDPTRTIVERERPLPG
jgi:GNAT superfamily N-acetyltransferase